MSNISYDARNASLTLGIEIIETSRNIKYLLRESHDIDYAENIRKTIDFMDGYLQHYRDDMKLEYYDQEKKIMIKFDNYEKAIRHIMEKLSEAKNSLEDGESMEYIYWLNRWNELLASCFPKLGLLPPSRAEKPQRQLIDEANDEEEKQEEIVLTDMGDNTEEENDNDAANNDR